MSHATVKPARVKQHSPEFGCDVVRGYGFVAASKGKRVGKVRRRWLQARADAKAYNAVCQGKSPDAA